MGWRRRRGAVARATAAVAEGLEGRVMLALPGGWSQQDIGTDFGTGSADPALSGAADYDGSTGTFNITGGGSDIWDGTGARPNTDHFHYAYRQVSGNTTTIVARVSDPILSSESLGTVNTWSKAGVMIRSTLNANSSHVMMIVSGAHAVSMQRRLVTGGPSAHDSRSNPGQVGVSTLLKLVREGTQFTAFYSAEPDNWTQLGPALTLSLAGTFYVGLAVTSHDNAQTVDATFQEVSIEVSEGLLAPTSFTAASQGTAGGIRLTWNDNSGNETGYAVERSSTSASAGFVPVASNLPADSQSYTDMTVTNGQHYWYRVRAFSGGNQGPYSDVVDAVGGSPSADYALSFDGQNDTVNLGDPVDNRLDIGTNATIESWVKFDSLPNNYMYTVASKDAGPGDALKWIFGYARGYGSVSNATFLAINSANGSAWVQSNLWTPVIGRWYHLALVKQGDTYTFYRDGVADGSTSTTVQVPDVPFPLLLGLSEGQHGVDGQLDEVRMWNVARTQGQIASTMNTTLLGNETGLTGYWNFNEAVASQLVGDSSPSGHDGTLGLDGNPGTDDPARVVSTAPFASGPVVQFTLRSQGVFEDVGNITIAATLSEACAQDVIVPFTVSGTANGADFTITQNAMVIPAGLTSGSITVTVLDDLVPEEDETIILTMGTAVNATAIGVTMHALTIVDNEARFVRFAVASQSVLESAEVMTVDVRLSRTCAQDVIVPYTLSGTADSSSDYRVDPGPLRIPAGSITAQISIYVSDDSYNEWDETVVITLGTPTNASLGGPSVHVVTILDNNDPPPTVQFFYDRLTAKEGSGDTHGVVVYLSGPSGCDVTVPLIFSGTATREDDYAWGSSIVIPAGRSMSDTYFSMLDDAIDEPDETVVIAMGTPTNATLGAPNVLTLTIVDNDSPFDAASRSEVYPEFAVGFRANRYENVPLAVATDRTGSSFLAGHSSYGDGTLQILIAKFSAGGAFRWLRRIGRGYDLASDVVADDAGNVYVSGIFSGSIDFSPFGASVVLTDTGSAPYTPFVSKLDADGNVVWAKCVVTGSSENGSPRLAVSSDGAVYVTGSFRGTGDMDPGAGTLQLTSAGDLDLYVSKLDSDGNLIWGKSFGGSGYESGTDIAVDSTGSISITGHFTGTVDFDPGPATWGIAGGPSLNVFTTKFDSGGNFLWARALQDIGTDRFPVHNSFDNAGNLYTVGCFSGTVDFDPKLPALNLTSEARDVFVWKLDTNGHLIWARHLGGAGNEEAFSVAVDASGDVYASGLFQGQADFDPGPGNFQLTSPNTAFVVKLDQQGDLRWARGWAVRDPHLSLSASGIVYVAGYFRNVVDFDPGPSTYNLVSDAATDVFLLKLVQTATPVVPSVRFVTASQSVGEDAHTIMVTAQLVAGPAGNITIPFTVDGTAINGADFTMSPSPLFISAGSTTAYITINLINDTLPENDKTIVISVQQPWGVTTYTATIVDDDRLGVVVPHVQIGSSTTTIVNGYFDLTFDVPSSRSATLAGYAAQLSLSPGNSGVRLTGVGEPANAVFPGRTPGVFGTGATLLVSDNLPGIGQANPIGNGMGLIRVYYEVQPQVKGTSQLRFDSLDLYDADAELIPGIQIVNGQLQVMDLTGPTVTGVRIGSTKWTASTFPYKDGYGIPVGSSQQLDALPWSSPDKLSMTFSENVTIGQSDLGLRGVNTPNYSFSAFNYDAPTRTATWTLSSSIMNDKLRIDLSDNVKDIDGNRLDGEWTDTVSTFPSGDSNAGGRFGFRLNVLRGDVNFSGNVGVNDVLYVRNQQFTVAGGAGYNAFYDINANGEIKINDVILVRNQQFTSLPAGDPLSAEQGPMPVRWEQASGLTATVQSVSVTSGVDSMVSGYVDVVLSVPPGFSGKLAGYESSVWLSAGGSGVSLKVADVAGGAIFGLNKPLVVNATASRLDVTDFLTGVGEEVAIADGGGLFRINFEVAAGVSGTFDVSLSGLHLYDGKVMAIEVGQVIAGRITVSAAQVQPVLRGTSGADVFRIAIDAVKQKLQVWQNASPPADPTGSYPVGMFDEVEIHGEGGQDALVVDATGGDPLAGVKLSIETGTIAIVGTGKVVRVGGLDVAAGATLDVGDGSLVVESCDAAAVGELIRSARGDGAWSGVGITSSAARGNEKGMTGLGVGVGANGEVVVKYTWDGDANVDGVVNADDYFQIDSGFISQKKGYYNGDFNYDGVINADDYFLIDSAFIGQGGPLAVGEVRPGDESPGLYASVRNVEGVGVFANKKRVVDEVVSRGGAVGLGS